MENETRVVRTNWEYKPQRVLIFISPFSFEIWCKSCEELKNLIYYPSFEWKLACISCKLFFTLSSFFSIEERKQKEK